MPERETPPGDCQRCGGTGTYEFDSDGITVCPCILNRSDS